MSSSATQLDNLNALEELSSTPFNAAIPAEALTRALASPPFLTLPGAFNFRDPGLFCPSYLAPGRVYRSGSLDFLPPDSRQAMRSKLGVKRVYDLRRNDEVKRAAPDGDLVPLVTLCPYMDGKQMPKPLVMAEYAPDANGAPGVGYQKMYDDILEGYTTGYARVFEALRDAEEGEAVLFHCTAGKDRTGVLSALILDLMGAPAQSIGVEYLLSRIGFEPLREKLLPVALESVVAVPPGATSADIQKLVEGLDAGTRGFLTLDAAVMVEFVKNLHAKHGGAEGYLRNELGFNEEDILKIRNNLAPRAQ
ncbi:hypothetical protein GQ53DRAFT_749559 [Thozetella sp. PMI_491]|nr:hypothetical protein GQ53DRAFT_749559 [Thozetella sp. PMI_491]